MCLTGLRITQVDTITKRRADLWLALAHAYEEDFDVSRAAASGLAMSVVDKDAADNLMKAGAIKVRTPSGVPWNELSD